MKRTPLTIIIFLAFLQAGSQEPYVSEVWAADNGDGTYTNPVLHADYSDPDAIRVGDDYYMVSSSFEDVPGLPLLQSKDLVNWKLVGHALQKLEPATYYNKPRHGGGVWAPSIRFHNGKFFIYYPDPDFGIYCITAPAITGPWSDPVMVAGGKGLIDPCPLWDNDGKAYLVHAFAGSRAGIKSVIAIKKLSPDGMKTLDEGVIVYDGHALDPTIEGPKLYRRNGWYYIFAPAGGVTGGWQLVLRSKNIYGPYERKVVMDQGTTGVNGPHQGAWVSAKSGEDWFLHFQDKQAYGRVVHLQPMKWQNNWPVIGVDDDGDGKGAPVLHYRKPATGAPASMQTPAETDEFNRLQPGLQWQWMGNPIPSGHFMNTAAGSFRLYASELPDSAINLWGSNNVLLQKFPAPSFTATVKLDWNPQKSRREERAGLTIMGLDYACIGVRTVNGKSTVFFGSCMKAEDEGKEEQMDLAAFERSTIYLRIEVREGGYCSFSYSTEGKNFIKSNAVFTAKPGKWKGAKIGIFGTGSGMTNDAGYADFDWFRMEKGEK